MPKREQHQRHLLTRGLLSVSNLRGNKKDPARMGIHVSKSRCFNYPRIQVVEKIAIVIRTENSISTVLASLVRDFFFFAILLGTKNEVDNSLFLHR